MKSAYVYKVELPADRKPGEVYPVLFTLHGKGSNEANMAALVAPLDTRFIRIHIRGALPLGLGFQYYELRGLGNPVRESFDWAVSQLTAFIESASETYPIDACRRYLLGFSQGAILAMTLALTMGNRLKGIVALNGYVPDFVKTEYPVKPVDQVSLFISHGEFDSVFPVQTGYANEQYFRGLNTGLTFKIYPSDHGVIAENQQDMLDWLESNAEVHEEKPKPAMPVPSSPCPEPPYAK